MSLCHHTRSRLLLGLASLVVAALPAAAEGIAFRFEGTVRNVFEHGGHSLGLPIAGGDSFVGTLSYDETAAPDPHDFCNLPGEDPGCAYYILPAATATLAVEVNGYVFGNGGDMEALVFVNASGTLFNDSFAISTGAVSDPSPSLLPDRHLQLWFRAPSFEDAITSTDLPTFLDFALFEPVAVNWTAGENNRSEVGINFDLTSLEIVPEPGVASLVGLGLGALSLIARRRRER
ncbi:MAG: PEP-CTERM sorting domain-containing protein [Myxococcota bacterium]